MQKIDEDFQWSNNNVYYSKNNHKINRLFKCECVCVHVHWYGHSLWRKFLKFLKFVMDLCLAECMSVVGLKNMRPVCNIEYFTVHVRVFVRSHKIFFCCIVREPIFSVYMRNENNSNSNNSSMSVLRNTQQNKKTH